MQLQLENGNVSCTICILCCQDLFIRQLLEMQQLELSN